MEIEDYVALEDRFAAHNYDPLDIILDRGRGAWVWDIQGRRYIDFLGGYSAVSQGHCHPRILQAMVDQASKLPMASRAFGNAQLPLFAQELCELARYEMMLPMNTGAEAVETALKAARKWGYSVKGVPEGKAEVITFHGNFHGRTITLVSFSSEQQYRAGYGPLTPGFRTIPFGDTEALEDSLNRNTVAILVEPIQAEGGVVVPPQGYFRQMRGICDRDRILLLADEIQTGLGRTGTLFALDWEGIRPDVLILGKALSGGFYPVSAVLADRQVLGLFSPGDHGSTFGGNPLACAVAREALRVLVEEDLAGNARAQGDYLLGRLARMESDLVADVRGRGLLVGIQVRDKAGQARTLVSALKDQGVLCKETRGNVIRLSPPLVITRDELEWALERIERVLRGDRGGS